MSTVPDIAVASERSDDPVSLALRRAYVADIAARYPGWSPERIPSADQAEVAASVGAWAVAYLDGRPVGCGGVKRLDDASAELERLSLAADARGRGLGRRLLAHLELPSARLRAHAARHARDLQPEALGLFTAGHYAQIPDDNGSTWASHWMEERLP